MILVDFIALNLTIECVCTCEYLCVFMYICACIRMGVSMWLLYLRGGCMFDVGHLISCNPSNISLQCSTWCVILWSTFSIWHGIYRQTYFYSNTHTIPYTHTYTYAYLQRMDHDCALVPRGALVVDASKRVIPSAHFDGLSFLSAGEKRSYMHCRKPESLQGTLRLYSRVWVA